MRTFSRFVRPPSLFSCLHARILTNATVLHPYYKLNYIRVEWGGEEEYLAALDAGDPNARDWNKYAREVTEKAVSH